MKGKKTTWKMRNGGTIVFSGRPSAAYESTMPVPALLLGVCVRCRRNDACEGDDRCHPCGGRYRCNDADCRDPGCRP